MTTPSPAAVARVEAAMLDTCQISMPGTEVYDPETNETIPSAGAVIYDGACQVAEAGNQGRSLARGGEPEIEHPYQVSVPRDVVPTPGQLLKVTAVHTGGDPALAGLQLVIRRVRYGTRMSRRILMCDLLQATAQ